MTRSDIPIFAHSPLSSEPSDRKLFPQTVVQSRDQIVSLEVIDPVLNVKLRQYYSRSRYAGNTVESTGVTANAFLFDSCTKLFLFFLLLTGVTSA